MTGWLVLRTFGALALVLAMLAGALWAVRRFDMRLPGGTGSVRGRTRRIETLERIPLDAKRALILVRADAMEHLILLAPDTNVLIASREAGSDSDAAAPGAEQSWQDALSAAVARLANPAPAVAPLPDSPPAPLPSSPLAPVAPPPPVPALGPPVHVISAAIETDLVFARPLPAPPARPAKRAAKPAKPATPRRPVASAAKAPARPRAAAPAAKAAGKSVGQSARSAKSATSAKAAKAPAARRRPAAR